MDSSPRFGNPGRVEYFFQIYSCVYYKQRSTSFGVVEIFFNSHRIASGAIHVESLRDFDGMLGLTSGQEITQIFLLHSRLDYLIIINVI
jgi:hypothetical protein